MRLRFVFATVDDTRRLRSAADATRLLAAAAGLVALGAAAVPTAAFERALARFATSMPPLLDGLWRVVPDVVAVSAVAAIVAAVLARRLTLVVDVVVALGAAVAVTSVASRAVTGEWPAATSFLRVVGELPEFPAARLAMAATVLITALPHLVAPLRRLTWAGLGVAAWSLLAAGAALPAGAIAAVLVGVAGAAIAHLALGATHARPSLADVAADLDALGVDAADLRAAERQSTGRFVVDATGRDGRRLVVKVYGRDADDAQLLRAAWRRIWRRGAGHPVPVGRVHQVEREALLTLFASDAGVPTHEVVAAGVGRRGDAVVVLTDPGPALEGEPSSWNESSAGALWDALAALHDRGISHGRVDDRHAFLRPGDGRVGLLDFHGAEMSPSESARHADEAQALVTTALALGPEAAVGIAIERLGAERAAACLPMLQPTALTRHQRRAVSAERLDLTDLRARVAEAAGVDPPELRKLQRVTVRTVIQVALMVVAFSALSAAFGNFDLSLLAREVRDGTWWLVALGLVLVQVGRMGSAVSTVGASPHPMPLGPVYVLQFALSYIGIAVPGSAARFAVNVRFLQRHGLAPGTAVAVSALDSVWWFVAQVGLVVSILVATPLTLDIDLDAGTADTLGRLATIAGVVVGVAVLAFVALPKLRDPVVEWARQFVAEARLATQGLSSPRRLGMVLGGNLAADVFLALALGAFARSLGYSVDLVELLLVNVSVSLLAGLLPIPGGIGVVEAGLTFGLVRAGLPDETALATALLYRVATFYLPPTWGFFALRWLERREML